MVGPVGRNEDVNGALVVGQCYWISRRGEITGQDILCQAHIFTVITGLCPLVGSSNFTAGPSDQSLILFSLLVLEYLHIEILEN